MKRNANIGCCLAAKSCPTLATSQTVRLLCPWDFPNKNTGVSHHFLFQGLFLTYGLKLCLLHWQANSLSLSHQGSPTFDVLEPIDLWNLDEDERGLSETSGFTC